MAAKDCDLKKRIIIFCVVIIQPLAFRALKILLFFLYTSVDFLLCYMSFQVVD